ncbi:MAG: permease [Candidatus Sumerlaeaceae bacterium]|nr:permease [Candidatus Sumerlaeaceae bacterium]
MSDQLSSPGSAAASVRAAGPTDSRTAVRSLIAAIEWKPLAAILAVFLAAFHLPVGTPRFDNAVMESLHLVKWYAREHVVLCLLPAFFIAGAIGAFVSQASVMKYLGPRAPKVLAYGVASVSGSVLAVCSCTILPLFAGIYRMGAGLGPAAAFLYAGPAINVLAIILTARILGLEIGVARTAGAVIFSILVGLLMHWIYRREEDGKVAAALLLPEPPAARPLHQVILYFASMVAILVFANWGKPDSASGVWHAIYASKWLLTAGAATVFAVTLVVWFGARPWKVVASAALVAAAALAFPGEPMVAFLAGTVGLAMVTMEPEGELAEWGRLTWGYAKQIIPLLLGGVLVAGLLLGRPGHEGLIPTAWVERAVGGNSLAANFFASVAGAFMYFATLTEVPIMQGLMGSGMGKGPALALLLAGPALSLPSMLVLCRIMGTGKTIVFVTLVVVLSTLCGLIYGNL